MYDIIYMGNKLVFSAGRNLHAIELEVDLDVENDQNED